MRGVSVAREKVNTLEAAHSVTQTITASHLPQRVEQSRHVELALVEYELAHVRRASLAIAHQ
jgi:hypothetical protein